MGACEKNLIQLLMKTRVTRLQRLKNRYNWEEVPVGRYGKAKRKVFLLRLKSGRCKYVLKRILLKTKGQKLAFDNEVRIARKVSQEWKTKLIDAWKHGQYGYILTSCLPETTSWFQLNKRNFRRALKTVIRQIKSLHDHSITHNDLALKNIVVNSKGESGLIDFEDAVQFDSNGAPSIRCEECPTEFVPDDDWAYFLENFLPFELTDRQVRGMDVETRKLYRQMKEERTSTFPIAWEVFTGEGLGLDNLRFAEGRKMLVKKIKKYR